MNEDAKPQLGQKDFSGGMATNLNPALAPRSTAKLLVNLDADEEIGAVMSRLGSGQVGAQLVDNMPVLGLAQYTDSITPANDKLFAAINASGGATSVIKDVADGSSDQTGLTASRKMRFLQFLGALLAVNGADGERSYDNAGGWITTGGPFDLGDFPGSNSCDIVEEFLDRVYAAGDDSNPDRLHFSSISNGTAIVWEGDYIDVEPEDGGGRITALAKVPGYLLIFKERSMKRFNSQSAFPESLVDIGTPSQECVCTAGGLAAFFSSSHEGERGFFITNGGRPVPISHDSTRPIKKWVDAIPTASEANIAAYATDRYFAWSVGDLTVDGVEYKNVHLRYNRTLNQWSVHTYPTRHQVFSRYLASGVSSLVGGDNDGNVIQIAKTGTFTDAPGAVEIDWELETQEDTYGLDRKKRVSDRLIVRGKDLGSPTASIVADGKEFPTTQDQNAGGPYSAVFSAPEAAEGAYLSYRVKGAAKGARAVIREITATKVDATQTYA